MNIYKIEQKIKTLSHLDVGFDDISSLYPEMKIDSYIFTQWQFSFSEGWLGDAWLVSSEIEAANCIEALNVFRNGLDKIVQKIGFVSQCYMDFYKEPFLIIKKNDNPDGIFFYKHIQEREGVGLHFGVNELKTYNILSNFKFTEVFRFLQECRNAIGYIPRLVLLFSALEAMCDKKEVQKDDGSVYIKYDVKIMKKILGNELYGEIFGVDGVRHKLNHGEMVEAVFGKNYVDEIYNRIIKYFNDEFGANINTEVVLPLRHFYDNHEFCNYWLKRSFDFEINLVKILTSYKEENHSIKDCDLVLNINSEQY